MSRNSKAISVRHEHNWAVEVIGFCVGLLGYAILFFLKTFHS